MWLHRNLRGGEGLGWDVLIWLRFACIHVLVGLGFGIQE